MPHINDEQVEFLRSYIDWFYKRVTDRLGGVLHDEVRYFRAPKEIADINDQASRLLELFQRHTPFDNTVDLIDDLIPIFKRMLIFIRRSNVAMIEGYKEKTHNPDLLETLDEKLKPLNELMEQNWLK